MDWGLLAWCVVIAAVVVAAVERIRREKLRRWMKDLIVDAKAGRLPETSLEDARNGVISVSEDGFVVQRGAERLAEVKWDAVEEVRGYKADLFGYDLICWGFCCAGDARMVEANEEMVGFRELQKAVGARYGVCLEDWWSQVAFPAFATNMTVIWSKKASAEERPPGDRGHPGPSHPPASGG